MQQLTQKLTQEQTEAHRATEAHRTDDCWAIPCIVRAVRAGDDRLIGTLLKRFAQHAEFDSLFRLREALQPDADPMPQANSACRAGH